MKFILLLLLICNSVIHAQPTLFKPWVGSRFEYMELYQDSALVYNPLKYKLEPYNVMYNNNTITLTPRTQSPSKTVKSIKLNIISFSADTLQLTTTDSLFYEIEPHRTKYTFTSKAVFTKQYNTFQKLAYSTHGRRMSSHFDAHIEIDSLGCIHVNYLESNFERTLYVGRLHIGQFKNLMKLVEDSGLLNITDYGGCPVDAYCHILFLVSNNQEHFYENMDPSNKFQALINYLQSLYKIVPLKLTKEKFEFSRWR